MNEYCLKSIKEYLSKETIIDFETSFRFAKCCSELLRNGEKEHEGREVVIRALDSINKIDQRTRSIWNDLVEAAGLYPYFDVKQVHDESVLLRYEYNKSRHLKNIYFHEEQNSISALLQSGKTVVISAPTSFGKSLLIEEVVASGKYRNMVIIQPTLALIDETRKKLQKYSNKYKIIVSTSQKPDITKKNIFLFTGERVVEYRHFENVDFFVLDEFYKLSLKREDERAIVLNEALYKLLKYTNQFYMLGPMIKSIPDTFKQKYEVSWIRTDFSTVAIDEVELGIKPRTVSKDREVKLFELLAGLSEPTLIYCSSPQKATDLSGGFVDYIKAMPSMVRENHSTKNKDIIEWVKENIHPNWILVDALGNSIGFHHGALPRHLGSSIVDAFNGGKIQYLFCTSTLIEGVNTAAKNVVLFDKRKGLREIDFFDYRNIAGRSGRMKQYYIGRVYKFHDEPKQMMLDVDIPILTQKDAPLELLIYIDESELLPESSSKIQKIGELDGDLRNIFKLNSGLSVEGQLEVIRTLEHDIEQYRKLLKWTAFPNYYQLSAVIELAWNNLLRKGENKGGVRSAKQLSFYTISYCEMRSLGALIRKTLLSSYEIKQYPDPKERVNNVVFNILNLTRHWFDYKLPNLLGAMSNLQKYVFGKHGETSGDYSFLSAQLQNGFAAANLSALLEYDIPISAIRKLEKIFNRKMEIEMIIDELRRINLEKIGLNAYEINKLKVIL